MLAESSQSDPEVQRKLQYASALVQRFFSPKPTANLLCEELGAHRRDRAYSPMITVWMFITQVISADKSCQLAVGRLNAWRLANGLANVSTKTTAFCKARTRLPELIFERLLEIVAKRCEQVTEESWLWHGRIVEMVDGWTVTMADLSENQAEYPQIAKQKTGCGFPIARMRGDTDFALTENFDRWSDDSVEFVFGIDAMPKLVVIAENLNESAWKPMQRRCVLKAPSAKHRAKRAREGSDCGVERVS